ncbi:secretory lipase [Corynebacterium imitans]|uniref:Secretory lipase n=1 Tax=Corynebacterium imitans TaxID=156978 RepID=A0A240AHW1_9CORY|nr:alpha/beta fold hydrolase [Corynebacterium imitans]SNV83012.1 secretory lipase [Corynebacterium imitans]
MKHTFLRATALAVVLALAPPAVASEAPGTLLATSTVPATSGERIRYTSTTEAGEIVEVTGALYDTPHARGLIALAPGTRGMADHCAPSAGAAMLSSIEGDSIGINYEAPLVSQLTRAGYRVVVTDYIGLGTPGTHTYLNRIEQGRALIDAARATAHDDEAIAFWGYSQGGAAAAAAAELVADYAPELDVRATFAGAPPADPLAIMRQGSAGMLETVVGYATISYASTYPEFRDALDDYLTEEGHRWLAALEAHCITDPPIPHGEILTEGRTLAELAADDERFTRTLNHNKLGQVGVSMPIMVMTNPDDDLVPEPQATQLAEDYAAHGSDVTHELVQLRGTVTNPLSSLTAPVFEEAGKLARASSYPISNIPVAGHAAPLLFNYGDALEWLAQYMPGKQINPGQVAATTVVAILAVIAALVPVLAPGFWPAVGRMFT